MPTAKGLFHRAVVESGSFLMTETPQNSARLAAAVLAELGLRAGQLDQLQTVSAQRLIRASSSVLAKLVPETQLGMGPLRLPNFSFAPVVDGHVLPENPFYASAPATSAKVPMIIGTCLNEFTTATGHPEYESMTDAEVRKRLSKFYGDEAGKIIKVFRRAYPGSRPFDLLPLISTAPIRQSAVMQAERKAAQGAAPVYLYWFTWQTPILDGRPRAFHCAEIAFVFDNTDRCENMTGGGAAARTLAGKMSDAWIHFARNGNPNHEGLPHWPAFTAYKGAVMIFDNKPEVKFDPDRAERSRATSSTLGD
jgi:para-nitrobenzyl esterase